MIPRQIQVWIDGLPIAQPRHRARRLGDSVGLFLPADHPVQAWKDGIAEKVLLRAKECDWTKLDRKCPVRVDCDFHFLKPTNAKKSDVWKITRPDRDNLDKAVLDAITKSGIWHDDAQACDGNVRKLLNPRKEGVLITITAPAMLPDLELVGRNYLPADVNRKRKSRGDAPMVSPDTPNQPRLEDQCATS